MEDPSRRALLVGTAGLAAAAAFGGGVRAASHATKEFRLSAAPGRWSFVGKSGPATDVWCYGRSSRRRTLAVEPVRKGSEQIEVLEIVN